MIQKKNRERGRGRKSMLKQVRQDIKGRSRVVWESSLYFFSNFPGYTLNYDKIVSYQKMKRIWELKLETITLNAFILLTSAFPSSAQFRILLEFCRSAASAPPASPHWRGCSVPTGWEGPELPRCQVSTYLACGQRMQRVERWHLRDAKPQLSLSPASIKLEFSRLFQWSCWLLATALTDFVTRFSGECIQLPWRLRTPDVPSLMLTELKSLTVPHRLTFDHTRKQISAAI